MSSSEPSPASSRNLHRGTLPASITPPPSSCRIVAVATEAASSGTTGFWGQTCISNADGRRLGGIEWNTECYPWYSSTAYAGGFFSPASDCPEGWKTVATKTSAQGNMDAPFLDGETAVMCCPAEMTYIVAGSAIYNDNYCRFEHTFTSAGPNNSFFPVESCRSGTEAPKNETWVITDRATQTVAADVLQLRFRSKIFGAIVSSPPPDSASESAETSGAAGMPNPNAIRDGAIVGSIVSFAILIGFAIGFWWLRRYRRTRKYRWEAHAEANVAMQQKNLSMQQNGADLALPIPPPPVRPPRADDDAATNRARDRIVRDPTPAPKPWTYQWLLRQAARNRSSFASTSGPPTVSELGSSAAVGSHPTVSISPLNSWEFLPKAVIEEGKGKQKGKEKMVVHERPIREEGGPTGVQTETSSAFAVRRERLERILGAT